LKLLVNPYDNFAFMLIRDRIGVDATAYGAIRQSAADTGRSHFVAWLDSDVGPWANFFLNPEVQNSLFTATTELHRMIEAQGAFFGIEASMSFVYAWMAENPVHTWEGRNPIAVYLDWLALYDIQDEIGGVPPGITLMTVHAAKGLEFDTVLVSGCNEGLLPSSQSLKAEDEGRALEAERRLAYVAWTRAKHLLVLTVRPEVSEVNGRRYENPSSRFIDESFGGVPHA
jgi:DNA helicase-2/ATP-dependent DNA helicase PcrA